MLLSDDGKIEQTPNEAENANSLEVLREIVLVDELLKLNRQNVELLNRKALIESEFKSDPHGLNSFFKTDPVLKRHELNLEKRAAIKAILDNRNTLVTARAGTGKTTLLLTLIYTLINKFSINKDEILLLTFNKNAREEQEQRLKEKYHLPAFYGAHTFHSLAYRIVEAVDPEIRDKIIEDQNNDLSLVELLEKIVKAEKETTFWGNVTFKLKYWQYLKELQKVMPAGDEYTTLLGEKVKSEGEKIIANYLFENGIDYEYEKSYLLDGVLYKPDFTLKVENAPQPVVLEYWGLNNSEYLAKAEKKRKIFEANNFILIEITPEEIADHAKALGAKLSERGIATKQISEEEKAERVFNKRFKTITKRIREFISYARVRRITPYMIDSRLVSVGFTRVMEDKDIFFSELANCIYKKFLAELKQNDRYDFTRLLERAAEIIDAHGGECSFALETANNTRVLLKDLKWILVDEFQDFSPIFELFIAAMQKANGNIRFVCVGDDWQAINGFAGSDTVYMDQFEKYFPNVGRAYLQTNRRSAQAIVEAGNNLMRHHGQKARTDQDGGEVKTYSMPDSGESLCEKYILEIRNIIQSNPDKSFFILTRNNKFLHLEPKDFSKQIKAGFDSTAISVGTIHKHKGQEADIVILAGATDFFHPFMHPERSLKIILGQNDDKITLDEKRLFYVALTRAKEKLYILTESGSQSPFIGELLP